MDVGVENEMPFLSCSEELAVCYFVVNGLVYERMV